MTKKHFIALADAVRNSTEPFTAIQLHVLARFCAEQNPAFNRERWIDYILGYCGKNGGKVKVGK